VRLNEDLSNPVIGCKKHYHLFGPGAIKQKLPVIALRDDLSHKAILPISLLSADGGLVYFTTSDGMALDTILIQREFSDEKDEHRRAERVAALIRQALTGEAKVHELVARAHRPQGRIKAFTVAPRVIVDNESSNRHTVIEVNGLDRIGLLYDLTQALYRLNLNIASAHIATFGERAVDVFYVTDLTGAKVVSDARRERIESRLALVLSPPQPAALSANS